MPDQSRGSPDYALRHLRFGWWSLFVFITFGLILETLHAFKVRAYLDVSNDTRRLMWTLAHAHGTLLSILHVIFGLSVRAILPPNLRSQRLISSCLIGASILLPGGFFLGGISFYNGDPGLGVVGVPLGASLLMIAVFLLAHPKRRAARICFPTAEVKFTLPARSGRDAPRMRLIAAGQPPRFIRT